MKKIIIISLLLLAGSTGFSQQKAVVKESTRLMVTYPFSDPDPIPRFTPFYPYFRYDGFTDTPVKKEWKVVTLSNDYISVMIMPEIGGKIWAATENSTGRSFLYYNHVVKFRDVAMRGPWTSGGLEANFGIMGHTPNCATPVDYITRDNPDGSVSCIIGALDLLTRSNWRIEINLPKDKAYFTTRSFWYNGSPLEQPYYHWMNAGVKVSGNTEFIYPGTHYLGHDGDFADWPRDSSRGKQLSLYDENNFGGYKSYHVFGKSADFFGVYWHQDHQGMVRTAPYDEKPGRKIWIWGLSRQGMIWEKLLTDTDGQYAEVQSGRLFNQTSDKSTFTPFRHTGFAPYATDTWKEYWYPVKDTKGFLEANEYGALNLQYEHDSLKIYLSPAQPFNGPLVVKKGGKTIYSRQVQLQPLKVFTDAVKTDTAGQDIAIVLGDNRLVYKLAPGYGEINRPLQSPADFDWNNADGLSQQGEECIYEKKYAEAEVKFRAALQKDPNYLPALVKLAALLYRHMQYEEALALARRALSINTYDGEANYYYGLINAQLNKTADARDGWSIAALSPAWRSAAYTELSKSYLAEKDLNRCLAYADKAMSYNRYNIPALQLMAVAYRLQQNRTAAEAVLHTLLSYDTLNHFARFEAYLWEETAAHKTQFVSLIRNELPQETYIELGIWYYTIGCAAEAEKVFELCPPAAEASYWLSFLQHRKVNFSGTDATLFFPFRPETAHVIAQLLAGDDSWMLKYHLALIYRNSNRLEESRALLAACANEPGVAPFYAVRAGMLEEKDTAAALADLQRALRLDSGWRYHKLLTEYYIRHRENEEALSMAGAWYKSHPDQYIMGMLYAKTLLLNKQYATCNQLLASLQIIPFEGATASREYYRETQLMLAVSGMKQRHYKPALQFVEKAGEWPEHLGVGKPYPEDIDDRLENWITFLCNKRLHRKNGNAALEKILQFNAGRQHAGTVFFPENAVVTYWAYKSRYGDEKARQWLHEEAPQAVDAKTLQWLTRAAEGKPVPDSIAETSVNARIIKQLMLLED